MFSFIYIIIIKKNIDFKGDLKTMDPDAEPNTIIIKLIILIALLFMSAFFSSAETAFISADKFKIRQLIQDGNKKAKVVSKVLEDKDSMISAILIGNNIVNIFASSLTTTMVYEIYGNEFVSIATGILTVVVLMFGEIMPKTFAGKYAEKISMIYAPILYILVKIMTPVIWVVNLFSAFFMRMFGIQTKASDTRVTEDVLKTMLDMSLEDDQIEEEEHEIIKNVLESNDSCAKEIMIPRGSVIGITDDYDYNAIMDTFKTEKYSRLVVLGVEKGNVRGIVYLKDFLFVNNNDFDINNVLREPYFTHETKNIQDLLKDMRKEAATMAVVLDEYGEMAGIVTIEDIVEEFVGQIRDEYDDEELREIKKISDTEYEVKGFVNLNDINEFANIDLESENYNSVGGYVIENMDEFPQTGDTITVGKIRFDVLESIDNKIERIKITIES